MRLIDADVLMTWFNDHYDDEEFSIGYISGLIKDAPTVEALSKETVLDALTDDLSYYGSGDERAFGMSRAIGIIERLPGGEKTQLSEESTTTLQQTCNLATDCISRQAALDAIDKYILGKPEGDTVEVRELLKLIAKIYRMPSAQSVWLQPLTDKEQRIFLAAMEREEKVCKQVDEECRDCKEPYEDSLVMTCREITRKVKGALWT